MKDKKCYICGKETKSGASLNTEEGIKSFCVECFIRAGDYFDDEKDLIKCAYYGEWDAGGAFRDGKPICFNCIMEDKNEK